MTQRVKSELASYKHTLTLQARCEGCVGEREGVTPATNWQSEGVSQKSIITSVILVIRAFAKCRLGKCSLAKNVNTYKGQLRYPCIFTSCTTPTETLAFLPHSSIHYTVCTRTRISEQLVYNCATSRI